MGDKTKIEWTDASWTPIRARNKATGAVGWFCVHVSEGCRNCYAETMNARLGTGIAFKPGLRKDVEIFLDDKILRQPLHWRRPRKIFVNSMTDSAAAFVDDALLDSIFAVAALCPQHAFQILTKRPDRLRDYLCDAARREKIAGRALALNLGPYHRDGWLDHWPLANVWLGVSVEDQAAGDLRIPYLLAAPAALRFLSCEPLLGPINLRGWNYPGWQGEGCPHIGWVIAGGESGPHARPMHPAWARSLRDQCAAAGVPFHFKQWGEWSPVEDHPYRRCTEDPAAISPQGEREFRPLENFKLLGPAARAAGWAGMCRIGKKDAGRLLDGVEHNGFPAAPALLERTA